jgi:hypothetical protein
VLHCVVVAVMKPASTKLWKNVVVALRMDVAVKLCVIIVKNMKIGIIVNKSLSVRHIIVLLQT